jgi:hypothetical protein
MAKYDPCAHYRTAGKLTPTVKRVANEDARGHAAALAGTVTLGPSLSC